MIPVGSKFKTQLKTPEEQRQQVDQKLRDVAQMYEKHFMNEMVKSMRSTVSESDLVKVSQGERIFREQLDQEYVGAWSERGGVGLSDLIYDQLVEKYGAQLGLGKKSAHLTKPQGPLPLNSDSDFKMKVHQQGLKSVFQVEKKQDHDESGALSEQPSPPSVSRLATPWSGRLLQKIQLSADEHFLRVRHENGLQSELKWNGLLKSDLHPGMELSEGQTLGYLSPDLQMMTWAVSPENVSE